MNTLLLITYVDFWNKGSGHRARISSIVSYFMDKVQITVFFAGAENDYDTRSLNQRYPEVHFVFASQDSQITFNDYKRKFKRFIEGHFFDIALIEYIELSIVLEYLPPNTITVLDTHDLVYDRVKSFKKFKIAYDGIILNKQKELNIFKCYDYVVLIHKKDFEKIAKELDADRLLFVPHPVSLKKRPIIKIAENVGFIASPYAPNIDALEWFISNVWEEVYKTYNLTLNVYGNIIRSIAGLVAGKPKQVLFHGFIDDLNNAYSNMDIIVNPIRCGAGLKIKNVEALGNGLPLITSSHGASGIEDGSSSAFLVANTPTEYLSAFATLMNDYEFRKKLSERAFKYAKANFSDEKCFSDLLRVMN
jgi:glycosyltransferase involved in cell wall biosynthesis